MGKKNKKPQKDIPENKADESTTDKNSRNETEGVLNFSKEMIQALGMALIFIVYVIQAFTIPTGSMEKSLLKGDFLLGLKFVYGSPVLPHPTGSRMFGDGWLGDQVCKSSYWKFPGLTSPQPGDVVIFKFPGNDNKDYIKRCIAGPGQTIEIRNGKTFTVDNKEITLPPAGQYEQNGGGHHTYAGIKNFAPLYIPKAGDQVNLADAPIREFLYYKYLMRQEHPASKVSMSINFYDADTKKNITKQLLTAYKQNQELFYRTFYIVIEQNTHRLHEIKWSEYLNSFDDWSKLEKCITNFKILAKNNGYNNVDIKKSIFIDDENFTQYTIKNDNYFMVGDNRDNSLDSRYWGFLNDNFVKAKAFILYMSMEPDIRIWEFWKWHKMIRWDRLGKLIRGWDGTQDPTPLQ